MRFNRINEQVMGNRIEMKYRTGKKILFSYIYTTVQRPASRSRLFTVVETGVLRVLFNEAVNGKSSAIRRREVKLLTASCMDPQQGLLA